MAKVLRLKGPGFVAGPEINRKALTARVQFGLLYRDGRARVAFDSPTDCDALELRAFATWLEELADVAEAASVSSVPAASVRS